MNFYTIIYMMILFIIVYVMLLIIRPFLIPIKGVWPNIPPSIVHKNIAGFIWGAMNQIMGYVLMFLLIMYIIWVIIKKFVPNFPIPFKKILLRMTPIKELDKSGLFGLIDAIVKIVPSIFRGKAKEGFRNLAKAILDFLKKSSGMIVDLVRPKGQIGGYTAAPRGSEPNMASTETMDETEQTNQQKAYLTPEQNQMVQQQYEQCMEENTTPLVPKMSIAERQKATLDNSMASTICNIQRFRTSSDMLVS